MRISRGMGAINKEKIRSIKNRNGNKPAKVLKTNGRVKKFANGGEPKSDLAYLFDPKETLKDIGYTIGEGLFGGDPDPNPPGTPVEERDEGIERVYPVENALLGPPASKVVGRAAEAVVGKAKKIGKQIVNKVKRGKIKRKMR